MSASAVTVHGAARFRATMGVAGRRMGDMTTANQKVAMGISQRARSAAPHRTGALARSTSGRAGEGNRAEMTATVVYAGVIHNGWRRHNIEPNPYLERTAEQTQAQWLTTYEMQIEQILSGVRGV